MPATPASSAENSSPSSHMLQRLLRFCLLGRLQETVHFSSLFEQPILMSMITQISLQALESAGHPDINIICEKVAFDGVTRFEDRFRLPLAVTVNFTSHTAKMLLEVALLPSSFQDPSLAGAPSVRTCAAGMLI